MRFFCRVARQPGVCQAGSVVRQVGLQPHGREAKDAPGFVALWVNCTGEAPRPASKEWLKTTSGREPQGRAGLLCNYGLGDGSRGRGGGTPSPPVPSLGLPNPQHRHQDQTSPFGEAGAGPKDERFCRHKRLFVGTKANVFWGVSEIPPLCWVPFQTESVSVA